MLLPVPVCITLHYTAPIIVHFGDGGEAGGREEKLVEVGSEGRLSTKPKRVAFAKELAEIWTHRLDKTMFRATKTLDLE